LSSFILAGNYFQVRNSLVRQKTNPQKSKATKEHNKHLELDYGVIREKRIHANNLSVARNNFKLLAHANITEYTKFITLTSKEILTIEQFSIAFNLFIKRYNKIRNIPLAYLGMYELQERGAPHIHFFAFDDNKIDQTTLKTLLNLWRKCIGGIGTLNIKTAQPKHINYLISYMTKDSKHKLGNKSIVRSRGNLKTYQKWPLHEVPKEIIENNDFNVEYARYMGSNDSINEYENIYGTLTPFGAYSFSDITTFGKVAREHSVKWLLKNNKIKLDANVISGLK
jgi:hypothetical protein